MDQQAQAIATEISALLSHYPARRLTQADRQRWLDDYVSDLSDYTAADVRLACAIWRKSDATKMATPGELLAICYRVIPSSRPAVLPPPKRDEPVYSEEHKAEMRAKVAALVNSIVVKDYRRRQGETEVDYGRRLWPNREVVR